MSKKQTYILLTLSLLTFTAGLYKYFVGSGIKINPFVDYEYYNRYGEKGISLSVFLYELNYMFEIIIVLLLLRYVATKRITKNIISPFIVIACFDVFDYLWYYKQLSYYKLPLLILLILLFNYKWIKSEKR